MLSEHIMYLLQARVEKAGCCCGRACTILCSSSMWKATCLVAQQRLHRRCYFLRCAHVCAMLNQLC